MITHELDLITGMLMSVSISMSMSIVDLYSA